MKPLYTELEFKSAKSRQFLPLKCANCSSTFFRTKNDIAKSRLSHRHETHNCCSSRCSRQLEDPPLILQCITCSKVFQRKPTDTRKSRNHFCSQSCAARWNNRHKKYGTRISKLEKWLATRLSQLYPSLEFHFNRKDTIESELDIFIPSLCLAFELNGVFHYEPIYGIEKLSSTQSNDRRKFAACNEHGIELCIIDVSTFKNFKEQQAIKFLNIIREIIDSRLLGSSPISSKTA